jgi:hypothetical protein
MDWTVDEVDLIIADYFDMLTKELVGESYNKTEHRNRLPITQSRGKKSVEFKHMNISAVLVTLGMPYIKGYRPAWNFEKKMLPERVVRFLDAKADLRTQFNHFAEEANAQSKKQPSFENWQEDPPKATEDADVAKEIIKTYGNRVNVNYIEKEQRNSSLGKAGEDLVYNYERWRLRDSFADQVRWISKEEGDGAGFDILSKNDNGTERYIEVKTTKLGKETPIFFTRNEYEFSKKRSNAFMLYRVFNFNDAPKFFSASGCFDDYCDKSAMQFIGRF